MDLSAISFIFVKLPDNRHKVRTENKSCCINNHFSLGNHIPYHSTGHLQNYSERKWQYLDKMVWIFRVCKAIFNSPNFSLRQIYLNRHNDSKILCLWASCTLFCNLLMERSLHVSYTVKDFLWIVRGHNDNNFFPLSLRPYTSDLIWTGLYWTCSYTFTSGDNNYRKISDMVGLWKNRRVKSYTVIKFLREK